MNKLLISVLIPVLSFSCFAQNNNIEKLYPFSENGKWGFSNSDNEIVIKAQYDSVFFPNNKNKALVAINDNKYALLNTNGENLTGFIYDEILYYPLKKQGYIITKKDDLSGIIESSGKIICNPEFEEIELFKGLEAARVKKDGKWGLVNKEGKMIIKPQFDYIRHFDKNGTAVAEKNKLYCHITQEGKILYKPKFEDAEALIGRTELFSVVKKDKKYGVINSKGNPVIPIEHEYLNFYCYDKENLPVYRFRKDKKAYYVNVKNETSDKISQLSDLEEMDFEFDEDSSTELEFYAFSLDIITEKDSVHFKIKNNKNQFEAYSLLNTYDSLFNFYKKVSYTRSSDIVIEAYKNGKVGLIKITGELIIPIEHDTYYPLNRYADFVFVKDNKKAIFLYSSRKFICDFEYTSLNCCINGDSYYNNYIYVVRDDGVSGYITRRGKSFLPKRK